ncbi:MAG: nuclear transport factor 2 family protein [Candidatus Marinimicrobia bacterium]|nr:nuclear transport factor 2 family protein [Candidatus Neomarinimicrobiota bacterium]
MEKVIRLIYCLLIFALILTIPSCRSGQNYLTENEKTQIIEEVKERMHQAFEAEKSLDVNRMIEIYANREGFVFGGDGYLTTDFDYLSDSFTTWANSMENWLWLNSHDEYVYVLSKDAAAYSFEFDWAILTEKGDTLKCKQGSWTFVLKKINGEWKSIHCNGTHIYE